MINGLFTEYKSFIFLTKFTASYNKQVLVTGLGSCLLQMKYLKSFYQLEVGRILIFLHNWKSHP